MEQHPPFDATDIKVLTEQGEVWAFKSEYWPSDKHKLLVFIPSVGTPVCATEAGALKQWVPEFEKLGCLVVVVGTDSPEAFAAWYEQEPTLRQPPFKTFSSVMLPAQLGLLDKGRTRRASVFVTSEGEVVVQQHFDKVGRSFADLHRQLYAYTTDQFCSEGWQDPSDGFLNPPS